MAKQARKIRQPRKQKTVRVGASTAKKIAVAGYGAEPEVGSDFSNSGFVQALNWYSSVEELGAHVESLYAEMKKRDYSKADIAAVKRAVSQKTFWEHSVMNVARMLQRNIILPTEVDTRWLGKINALVTTGRLIKEEKIAVAEEKGIVISIQERTANKASEMFEVFDDLAEQVWTGQKLNKDIKPFEIFKEMDIKPAHARHLLERFTEEAAKYEENPKDYARETLKVMPAFWASLRDAAATWASEKQVKPKTDAQLKKESVRKALTAGKKAEKAVSTLKYKTSDDGLGVISSNPSGILGAQTVVLFNTKYNVLTMLHATNAQGLSIRGTTITGVDAETSRAKRAGRAGAVVKVMASQPKTALKKSFDSIKGTEMDAKGRTNEDTIIVRIIK